MGQWNKHPDRLVLTSIEICTGRRCIEWDQFVPICGLIDSFQTKRVNLELPAVGFVVVNSNRNLLAEQNRKLKFFVVCFCSLSLCDAALISIQFGDDSLELSSKQVSWKFLFNWIDANEIVVVTASLAVSRVGASSTVNASSVGDNLRCFRVPNEVWK